MIKANFDFRSDVSPSVIGSTSRIKDVSVNANNLSPIGQILTLQLSVSSSKLSFLKGQGSLGQGQSSILLLWVFQNKKKIFEINFDMDRHVKLWSEYSNAINVPLWLEC